MARATPPTDAPRAQRVVAAMAFTLIGVSAIAVIALLVLHGVGLPQAAFRSGPLAILAILPLPGLAIGLLLVIALIVMTAIRRSRS